MRSMDGYTLRLMLGAPYPCNYLPGRIASNLFIDPNETLNPEAYTALATQGFRRSGEHVYRPHCASCEACIPVRIPVNYFEPDRRQRRAWSANQDLAITRVNAPDRDEHLALFSRYVQERHAGGGMDDLGRTPLDFLSCDWCETHFYEFRLKGRLLAVAAADRLIDGLSAVYTYFEPEESGRSLGTFAVLWEIHEARRLDLSWLYLGYWIKACRKMAYKDQYRPMEIYRNDRWRPFEEK